MRPLRADSWILDYWTRDRERTRNQELRTTDDAARYIELQSALSPLAYRLAQYAFQSSSDRFAGFSGVTPSTMPFSASAALRPG